MSVWERVSGLWKVGEARRGGCIQSDVGFSDITMKLDCAVFGTCLFLRYNWAPDSEVNIIVAGVYSRQSQKIMKIIEPCLSE
jgi:hypothetical protein